MSTPKRLGKTLPLENLVNQKSVWRLSRQLGSGVFAPDKIVLTLALVLKRTAASTRNRGPLGPYRDRLIARPLSYLAVSVRRTPWFARYEACQSAGYFIGSGVVEAGCKTVIGGRCKQSGMRWSKPGAENILALRCIHSSHRLGEFWKHRLDSHASRSDALNLAA
jgi:hypothetical protein